MKKYRAHHTFTRENSRQADGTWKRNTNGERGGRVASRVTKHAFRTKATTATTSAGGPVRPGSHNPKSPIRHKTADWIGMKG